MNAKAAGKLMRAFGPRARTKPSTSLAKRTSNVIHVGDAELRPIGTDPKLEIVVRDASSGRQRVTAWFESGPVLYDRESPRECALRDPAAEIANVLCGPEARDKVWRVTYEEVLRRCRWVSSASRHPLHRRPPSPDCAVQVTPSVYLFFEKTHAIVTRRRGSMWQQFRIKLSHVADFLRSLASSSFNT